jgi:hypothetical protein
VRERKEKAIRAYVWVASGEKARQTHEMPRLPSRGKRGRRGISCVRLAFSPEATYNRLS